MEIKDKVILGARIAKVRNEQNISREMFAEKLHRSFNHIGVVERGGKLPSMDLFIDMCNELNQQSASLLFDYVNSDINPFLAKYTEQMKMLSPEDRDFLVCQFEETLEHLLKKSRRHTK